MIATLPTTRSRLPYSQRLRNIRPGALLAYWPMDALSSPIANVQGIAARDGTIAGTTPRDGVFGGFAPHFDGGATCLFNGYSSSLGTAIDVTLGSMACWARVPASAWTDATARVMMNILADSTNNYIEVYTDGTNNELAADFTGGGTNHSALATGLTTTDWFHCCMTWSKSPARNTIYIDGVQKAQNTGAFGTWSGAIVRISAGADTASVTPWLGDIQHFAIWNAELTAGEVRELARRQ